MDLRVKIQPKEIFIYSMYNFWAGLRGIGCIILTVLVIIAAAASEERLGTQVTNLVILGVIALTGFQIFAIWKQAERTAGDAKTGAEIVFHIGDEGIRARQANCKGEISWDKSEKDRGNICALPGSRQGVPDAEARVQRFGGADFSQYAYKKSAAGKEKRNSSMMIETNSPEETYAFGKKLGMEAQAGQVYCLNGDLGVGKTVFTQGFAAGLGIQEPVNSPTFTIVQEYDDGRLPLYHFDVYRLGDVDEMDEIGYEDYFYGEGICLIEWSERIREILPEHPIQITIEKDLEKGFDYRKISVNEQ